MVKHEGMRKPKKEMIQRYLNYQITCLESEEEVEIVKVVKIEKEDAQQHEEPPAKKPCVAADDEVQFICEVKKE